MLELCTIGVYGFDAERLLGALRDAGVGVVLDVRQRRGVRGREYAWANAARLQTALAEAGIGYRHLSELAPTTALRELQYAADARAGVGKRSRAELAPAFAAAYEREILDRVGTGPVLRALPPDSAAALLCVERDPGACHRSLIARRVASEHRLAVRHLLP